MKRIILNSMLIVLAAFIFSACHSGLSITKRKYNKGYFVQHHSRKQVKPVATDNGAPNAVAKAEKPEQVYVLPATQAAAVKPPVQSNPQALTASAAKKAETKAERRAQKAAVVEMAIRNPIKSVNTAVKLMEARDTGDDALSLLWVIVVIILIVYLLGLLFDGFGLGNLIHILAVIAIVLLILWLLRIL